MQLYTNRRYNECWVLQFLGSVKLYCICTPTAWQQFIHTSFQSISSVSLQYLDRLSRLLCSPAGKSRCRTSCRCSCTERAQHRHRCESRLHTGLCVCKPLRKRAAVDFINYHGMPRCINISKTSFLLQIWEWQKEMERESLKEMRRLILLWNLHPAAGHPSFA